MTIFHKLKSINIRLAVPLFLFLIIGLSIPLIADGFVLDLAQTQLAALSEKTGPFMAFFLSSVFLFVIGMAVLYISISLLSWIITVTPQLLVVTTAHPGGERITDVVMLGWNFTTGIVNLILIIAFIIIAFAVMLGSEKIQLKKAMPKLILVALLVNFTLLFVGAGIDISNFLFRSISDQMIPKDAGLIADTICNNVLCLAVLPLFEFSGETVARIAVSFGLSVAKLMVPYMNVIAQAGWILGFFAFMLPLALQLLTYGIIAFMLAFFFFTFFLIFFLRIFAIQILAILAPLAFFCLIFDNTKKYWTQWVNHLTQWLFVGVYFIFLLYIGLLMGPVIQDSFGGQIDSVVMTIVPSVPGYLEWLSLGDIIGYIALIIFFATILGFARSFIPATASAVIDQVSGAVKTTSPFIKEIKKGSAKRYRDQALEAKKRISQPGRDKWHHNLTNLTDKVFERTTRWAYKETKGVSLEKDAQNDIDKKVEENRKSGLDPGELLHRLSADNDCAAALKYAEEKEGKAGLEKLSKKDFNRGMQVLIRNEDIETILKTYSHDPKIIETADKKGMDLENAQKLSKLFESKIGKLGSEGMTVNVKKAEEDTEGLITGDYSDRKKTDVEININEAYNSNDPNQRKIALSAAMPELAARILKASDIEKYDKGILKNEELVEAILRNRNSNFIVSMEKEWGNKASQAITQAINNTGIDRFVDTNPTLARGMIKVPALQTMVGENIQNQIQESLKNKSARDQAKYTSQNKDNDSEVGENIQHHIQESLENKSARD